MAGKPGPKPGDAGYRPPRPRKERILARVEVDENGCWVWQGPRDRKGYGHTFFGSRVDGTRRAARVHRVAYEEWVGPIPRGLAIDHLCENPSCCNPNHLEAVTGAENKKRAGDRMTACRRGHPRTPENVYVTKTGKRQCRACRRIVGS